MYLIYIYIYIYMKCTVECSYGEVVDKITILKIKLENVKEENKRKNILKEYNILQKWIKKNDTTFDKYFNDLYNVNKKLWELEDNIREKSKNKDFDAKYIEYAEQIHFTNDNRYLIKSKINDFYNSDIKEEKLYVKDLSVKNDENKIDNKINEMNKINKINEMNKINKTMNPIDIHLFDTAIKEYSDGNFAYSFNIIDKLCEKYVHADPTNTVINLFFCMDLACYVMDKKNVYEYKLHEFINIVDDVVKDNQALLIHLKTQYAHFLLKNKNYTDSKKYVKYLNKAEATNLNINYDTMSYFKENDVNKTLFIYAGGGFGDKIMFARFIRKVCETNPNNKIIFMIDDCLCWIYSHIYRDIENIRVIGQNSMMLSFINFDYHVNIIMLMFYLSVTYETLYTDYYLTDVPESQICLKDIIDPCKKNIVINWHGNYQNICEKNNRGMNLKNMIPLFENEQLKNINWISVQKEVNQEEIDILQKYNVKNLYKIIDNDGDAFKDTLTILKNVDLVISTDTSLVHIAATANIKCWALLTVGCEWRWGKDKLCAWYPKIKLIRQKTIGDWNHVIKTIMKALIIIQQPKTNADVEML